MNDDPKLVLGKARQAFAKGDALTAERLARSVLTGYPDLPPAMGMHARALLQLDMIAEAQDLYSRLCDIQPERGEWPRMLVRVLGEANRFEEAEQLCRKIISREGKTEARLHMVHGDLLHTLGKGGAAAASFRAALGAEPGHGRAIWSLARSSAASDRDGLVRDAGSVLNNASAPPPHQALARFAMGELHHALDEFDEAFEQFAQGNAILAQLQPLGVVGFARELDRLAKQTSTVVPASGAKGPTPIFILGMPRSGSTLIERMLACHTQIESLGELPSVARLSKAGEPLDAYVDRASTRRVTKSPCFIDKMHLNWRFLPEILNHIPQARIIDIRRDPMDCCWSNFRFPFDHGHPASTDLGWLGLFYRGYDRVLERAAELFPDRVLRIDYEALIENPETLLRCLFTWLDLEFEASCLDFHRSTAPVATASSEQVRQPINRKGIGVHKPYLAHLGPLEQALKD